MKVAALHVLAALTLVSCKSHSHPDSEPLEFTNVQPIGGPLAETHVRLNLLEAGVPGITRESYQLTKTQFVSTDKQLANANVINVEFPSLSIASCQAIKKFYSANSKIDCKAGPYSLQDFLFPAIQATLNKQFANENIVTPFDQFTDKIDALQNNCWAVTYEVQRRAADAFYLFQMNGTEAKRILRSNTESKNLAGDSEVFSTEVQVRAMLQKAQFGDVLLIYYNGDMAAEGGQAHGEILHAATIIDAGGLAFERTGWAKQFAMRFVSFDDIIAQYPPKEGAFAWELRRMHKPLLTPGEVIKDWNYGGELKGKFSCAKIPFVFDARGRASLPPESAQPLRSSKFMSQDCIH